jgi:hypothetical protein
MPRTNKTLHETTERIVFDGVPYRRYPNSPKLELRNYFICSPTKGKSVRRLHQAVWEFHNGPIPEGHHVHHKDENTLNNDISNLECLSNKEHRRSHWTPEDAERARKMAEAARPLTKEWHASEEGRQWHSENGKKVWEKLEATERTCIECAKTFMSKCPRPTRFCGNNCKQRAYMRSKRESLEKVCMCGKSFKTNPHQPREHCSHSCATKSAWKTRNASA